MIDFSKPCESFEQACSELVHLASERLPMARRYAQDCTLSYFCGVRPMDPRWLPFFNLEDQGFFNWTDPGLLGDMMRLALIGTHDVSFSKRWERKGQPGITFIRARTQPDSKTLRARKYPTNGDPSFLFGLTTGNLADGHWDALHEYVAIHNGKLVLSRRGPAGRFGPAPAKGTVVLKDLLASFSLAFTQRYEWRVNVGAEDCLSIGLTADRSSLPEIFRLRDIPNGKSRRAALLHFVTSHWKRSRSQAPTEDPAVFIREHLRGQTKFSWNGLTCEVIPPRFDVERLQRAREEARPCS